MAFPARLMLAYTGDRATVKRYPLPADILHKGMTWPQVAATFKRLDADPGDNAWFQAKRTLGLDFPTVPYYIEGELKLTQTLAIVAYLEQKHSLWPPGSSSASLGRDVMLACVTRDWFEHFRSMIAPKSEEQYAAQKKQFLDETLPKNMQQLERFLPADGFAMGSDTPTCSDFFLFDYIDLMMRFAGQEVFGTSYPKVVAFHERFARLPAVEKLKREEPEAFWPAFPVFAMWGSD